MEENNYQITNIQKANKNTLFLIILSILVFLLGGFIIYDKVIKKEDSNITQGNSSSSSKIIEGNSSSSSDFESSNEDQISSIENDSEETNLDNPIVKNLKYPMYNSNKGALSGFSLAWEYVNTNVNTMNRAFKILSAGEYISKIIPSEECQDNSYCSYATALEMKKGFIKLFGPDAQYSDGALDDEFTENCGALGIYDSSKQIYHDMGLCGVEGDPYSWSTKAKAYKVEMNEDYIFVYHYFVYIIGSFENYYYFNNLPVYNVDFTVSETFKIENASTSIYKGSDETIDFDKLASENKLKTYKYTFKKQSDGNYYFYSGELQ